MGDVPFSQDRTPRGAPEGGSPTSGQHSSSTASQLPSVVNLQGPPQLTRSTQRAHQTLQHAGVEYYPAPHGPHGFIPPGGHGSRSSTLSMGDMSSALPVYQPNAIPYGQQAAHQQFIPTHQPQGLVYSVQQLPFHGQAPSGAASYTMPYQPAFQAPYGQHQHSQETHFQQGMPGYQQYLSNPPAHQGSTMSGQAPLYVQPYLAQQQHTAAFGPSRRTMETVRIPQQTSIQHHDRQASKPTTTPSSHKESEKREVTAEYDVSQTIVDGSSFMRSAKFRSNIPDAVQRQPPSPVGLSTPRGPPRKPKQSGHALWVGNLPSGVNVVDLKDHFSRDATNDIESVFLISRSNCAFVNYKTEVACAAAVTRFHDSRFQGVRLVCRPRRSLTVAGSSCSNPFIALSLQPGRAEDDARSPLGEDEVPDDLTRTDADASGSLESSSTRIPERFFIVKSLTVEDLELSKQSGIWATQTHNEATFNEAYESANNVYLIFSANKSGEYFGYARMISPINDDEALALEKPPRPEHPPTDSELVIVTPTVATATAPKGRIIDDAARGTIFWEADSSDDDADGEKSVKSVEETVEETLGSGSLSFGKPFRIEWISTERVPFHRTRGLRNPWNSNREVKIARDGTEIEPSVGKRLTQLFHVPTAGQRTTLPSSEG